MSKKNDIENVIVAPKSTSVHVKSSSYCYIPIDALIQMEISFGSILCYGLILRAIHWGYRECNNAYLSDILKVSPRTITSYIKELCDKGALKITIVDQYIRKIVPLVYPEFYLDSRGAIPFVRDDAGMYIKNTINQSKIDKIKSSTKKISTKSNRKRKPYQTNINDFLNSSISNNPVDLPNGGFDELK